MIFVQVLVYIVSAGLGAVIAKALEAKLGQHLGMGVLAWMASWLGGWVATTLAPDGQEASLLAIQWLLTGAGIALICTLAAFLVYTVNARQALIIGSAVGAGHVLFMGFMYWAMSSV